MFPDSISFPNLGITFPHVGQSFSIAGFEIAFYGIIVAAGMAAGIYLAMWLAKKTGQSEDAYFNFAIAAIILSVIGARLYYVIFSWDYYSAHPLEILDFRGGGLAIYGGVITGVICAVVFAKRHKISIPLMLDTGIPALSLGQAIGRWGNFFNREAFGRYSNGLLAMQLPLDSVRESEVTGEMLSHAVTQDGLTLIRVHPTFLYESMWNLALTLLMVAVTVYTARLAAEKEKETGKGNPAGRGKPSGIRSLFVKRFEGQVFCMYLAGYGIGRFWIEGLRTDQLLLPYAGLPVSQVVSAVLAAAGVIGLAAGCLRAGRR